MKKKLLEEIDPKKATRGLMHPVHRDLLSYSIYKLGFKLRARIDAHIQRADVVAPQCAMLSLLAKVGPMTQVQLGRYLSIDKATMVRFLDRLEQKKMILRSHSRSDGRAKTLVITPSGKKMLLQFEKARAQVESEVFSVLNTAEKKILRNLIFKLTVFA